MQKGLENGKFATTSEEKGTKEPGRSAKRVCEHHRRASLSLQKAIFPR